jgi:RimJ/RimL family protein N-acetyltransferase
VTPESPAAITTTSRLRLREITYDDAAFVMELVNDPDWLRFIGDRNVHSLEDARGYVDRVRASYDAHGFGLWAVEPLTNGAPMGLAGLLKRATLDHPDLGFAFLPEGRGRGFALEAASAVLELGRERFGLARVLAITNLDNAASQRLLRRVGFGPGRPIRWEESAEDLLLFERVLR